MTAVESAWPRYPGYRIDLVPLEGVGRAELDGVVIAESDRCLLVRESDHRDQLYFPLADVPAHARSESTRRTTCPFKGEARYATISNGPQSVADALWWYADPMDEVAGLRGYGAFDHDRIVVTASAPLPPKDAATTRFPIWGTAADLARLMDPVTAMGNSFVAPSYPDPPVGTFFSLGWHGQRRNVVEGGQLLGAAIVAAAKLRSDQRVSSAHMAFVKAASFDEPLHVTAEPRRLGGSMSVFDVEVTQGDKLRATALVTTDAPTDDLIRHTVALPDVPPPDECTRFDFGVLGRETRFVDDGYTLDPQDPAPPVLYTWTRFAEPPDRPALQLALLAQDTTHYAINAAMRPHPEVSEGQAHRTISTAPVNATVSFHDEVDVTEWLLTETQSIYAGRGSTHSQARVFTADGRLVASKSIQAIIRPFARSPEQQGRDFSTVM